MLTIEPMLKNFSLWVKFIEDGICVGKMAGSENDDLKLLGHFFKETDRIGSNVDAYSHILIVDFEVELQIRIDILILHTMNQSLI